MKTRKTASDALTASTLLEDKETILAEGADAFLRKPFREEELFDAIARFGQVDFVYEENPEACTGTVEIKTKAAREAFQGLPETISERLRSVIMRGAISEAESLCAELEEHDAALAALLKQRTREYRLNELQSLWMESEST